VGVSAVLWLESRNRPQVIHSIGIIARAYGPSPLTPLREGALVWASQPAPSQPQPLIQELHWNRETVQVGIANDQLVVRTGQVGAAAVDLSRYDYVREAYAVPARLTGGSESLALLLHLRSSSQRDLLLIFDPAGRLVHEELLERESGRRAPRVGLGVAGGSADRQEILVHRGTLLRFVRIER